MKSKLKLNNSCAFFNLMILQELEKPSRPTAPTKDWWQGKTPKSCLCRKTTEILREVLNIPDVSQYINCRYNNDLRIL